MNIFETNGVASMLNVNCTCTTLTPEIKENPVYISHITNYHDIKHLKCAYILLTWQTLIIQVLYI